jgi:Tfp pilus assembly protein PilV
MCSSNHRAASPLSFFLMLGFTLIEVLLALSLSLMLGLSLLPLWHSLEQSQVRAGDRAIALLQGRLAASRFEKDLRLAASVADPRGLCSPVIAADPVQVILLTTAQGRVDLVEWEFVSGRLMRRSVPWSGVLPTAFPHGLYTDHKTMLEGVVSGGFLYETRGVLLGSAEDSDLAWVSAVLMEGALQPDGKTTVSLAARGRVGR